MAFMFRANLIPMICALSVVLLVGFTAPSKQDRTRAIGSLSGLDSTLQKIFSESPHFEAKREPQLGDWLAQHEEPGQTFRQYLRSGANTPGQGRTRLYIQPLGKFESEQAPDLDTLEEFTTAYFYPMPVTLLPPIEDAKVRAKSRIHAGHKQWNSKDILSCLPSILPHDAYSMIAVTMTDLYPEESWNFVFGQASTKRRVGVFSFARYHPSWRDDETDEAGNKTALVRALKVLTHETGHMFGIRHCTHFQCNMNGANSLDEADRSPEYLCPICLRKLHHAIRFSPVARYEKLQAFYKKHDLATQEKWVEERLKWISE